MDLQNDLHSLEHILYEIEKQRYFKRIGYILSPIVIGILIIKRSNKNIQKLLPKKEDIISKVKSFVREREAKAEHFYEHIKKSDTYLIYSVRNDLKDYLKKYLRELTILKNHKGSLPEDFNSFIEESYNNLQTIKENILNFNKEFVERRKKEYESLFKNSPFTLDDDQKTAIIIDDKHNLVVAGAGSGKTEVLTTRIAYLTLRKPDTIASERILALAFQKEAAKEMKDRLKKRYGINNVDVRTFHSLGLSVLRNSGKAFTLLGGDNYEIEFRSLIKEIHNKLIETPEFQRDVIKYMGFIGDEELKQETEFAEKKEFYNYMRGFRYKTLNGRDVKSLGEKAIMNFLLTHKINKKRIDVKYEEPAQWMKYTKDGKEYIPSPDFHLSEFDIYIEHWGIDKNGNPPPWFEDGYVENMNIKKREFKNHSKSLIETTYGEFRDKDNFSELIQERIIAELRKKFPDQKFEFTKIPYKELIELVWDDCADTVKSIATDISKFILIAKTYNLNHSKIKKRLKEEKWSKKQHIFADIALQIYEIYQKKLKSSKKIDYADMINLAIEDLKKNKNLYKNKYDQILVDEYQDISKQRFILIKTLMDKNDKCKLFCVGDDWQSIMGFSGSDVDFFVKFSDWFDHPARTDLKINYRSNRSVVETGAEIIKNNKDKQLEKITISKKDGEKTINILSSLHQDTFVTQYYNQIAEHCIRSIHEYHKKGLKWKDMMILCRIKKSPKLIQPIKQHAEMMGVPLTTNHNEDAVRFLSVHRSKGLQAKIVFILNMNKGTYGFPCELENPEILEPAIGGRRREREEEERRLFYVALTRAEEEVHIYNQKCKQSKFLKEINTHVQRKELAYN